MAISETSNLPSQAAVAGINTTTGDRVWGQCDAGRGMVGVSNGGTGVYRTVLFQELINAQPRLKLNGVHLCHGCARRLKAMKTYLLVFSAVLAMTVSACGQKEDPPKDHTAQDVGVSSGAAVSGTAVGTVGAADAGWKVDTASAVIVGEITGGIAKMVAKEGALMQIQALVSPPQITRATEIDKIFLVGVTDGEAQASSWEVNPVAVGGVWKEKCSYFITKNVSFVGVMSFGGDAGPTLKREGEERAPAMLEFKEGATATCLGFHVPTKSVKSLRLRLGGAEHPVSLRE